MTWRAISARPYEMSSTYNTSARLHDKFQNLRYVITERVVNNAPVWATEDGVHFMYRCGGGRMIVGGEESCAAGKASGWMHHTTTSPYVLAPTQLRVEDWKSHIGATHESHRLSTGIGGNGRRGSSGEAAEQNRWVNVPAMRIDTLLGLDDDEPAMAAALQQLAVLTAEQPQPQSQNVFSRSVVYGLRCSSMPSAPSAFGCFGGPAA